jgi:hypothetical protein
MVGLPNYLATKQDFENAFDSCKTITDMQALKRKFEGVKAQDKIKVLKESVLAKAAKSAEDGKEAELSADDFEEITAPVGVKDRFGISITEIDALIEKLNKKIAEVSK